MTNPQHFSWADLFGLQQRKFREAEIVQRVHDLSAEALANECRQVGLTVEDQPIDALREALIDVLRARPD